MPEPAILDRILSETTENAFFLDQQAEARVQQAQAQINHLREILRT
jgi:hypothetical protein